ncbi:MAG: hypothetical protein ABI776_15865 [Nocardioidaceae bacterium]
MALLVLLVLVGVPLLLTVIASAVYTQTRAHVETHREWSWVRVTWAAALVTGALAAWLVERSLDLGRGAMLVPAVLGLSVVAAVGLAETVVRPRRPTGPRTASLSSRRVADYLPRSLAHAVGGITALHLVTLAMTTATASADDMGRAGRQIAARCGTKASAAGPYPGSFYAGPLVLLLLVIGLIATAALTAVVRRARGFATDEVGDDVLRRQSTSRVLAATGAAVAASHVGIAFFAGTALLRMECQRAWMVPVGWLLVATVAAALVLLGWFLIRLVAPGAVPAPAPAAASR